ncbi:MAG: saccharopine dehydrogenase NADP-binding domain-containing protein [Anaerolineales bacterium]|nr:saccharopine dehydrogenase NADP-binding domain-containing protein [Anaerolineales bacterium]MCX7608965.1 saccharopine dehydrogenase NADP-binding domain-containing protein [Anaerolineales bacterium]
MKVLLLGVGGVGEGIARIARDKPWLEQIILADYHLARAQEVYEKLGKPVHFAVEKADASDIQGLARLASRYGVDLILNAVSCEFSDAIFEAAYQANTAYMDMALSGVGADMGRYQFDHAPLWEEKGLLALIGMGMDPGVSDIFAKYAAKHLFDEIDEIGIRDGAALQTEGYEFAPTFSIYDTIEECTDPALIWQRDKGWYQVEPFSEPELFPFPEGIGPMEVVNVEHEEVVLIPRWIRCNKVTFKYGLGEKFIQVIRTLKMLGLHRREPVNVKGIQVAPLDVVAALLPDPAKLGPKMSGKTCVGTWVTGWKDGQRRSVYLYQVMDNQEAMQKYGIQAVSLQTAIGPVIGLELLAKGIWQGKGVLGPEAFDPDPFLERMPGYDFPYQIIEIDETTIQRLG